MKKVLTIFCLSCAFLFNIKISLSYSSSFVADPTFTDQNTGTTYTSDGGMYYRDSLGTVFTTPQGKSYFGTEPSGSFGQSNYVDSSGTNSGSSYTDSLGNTNFNFNNTPKSSYSPIPYTNSNRTEQSSYTKIATPSCPQNSYYDGVSTCKCNYGYENQGLYCVLKAVSPSCPLYSHRSGDLKTCVCDLGFQMDKNSNICNRIQHESLNSVIPAQKNNTVNFSDSKNRGNLNYDQFAEAIKGAYPEYNHIDNQTLTTKMLSKYPESAVWIDPKYLKSGKFTDPDVETSSQKINEDDPNKVCLDKFEIDCACVDGYSLDAISSLCVIVQKSKDSWWSKIVNWFIF